MTLLANFPHTATARLRTRTKGALGGSKDTYTTVFTDRACWRQSVTARDIVEFEKRGVSADVKVYFLSDPELNAEHILVIDGDTFEVVATLNPDASAGLGVVWRTLCNITTTGSTTVSA